LFRQRPEIVDGFMSLPDTPGLGLELRQETLESYGVKVHKRYQDGLFPLF
jgi:L-alanine-DL-glutamate epimerase-like enolase superfamily enzyme